jgi:hypothetical protein
MTPRRLDPFRHGIERILTQLVELAAAVNEHVVGARLQRVATSYRESFELAKYLEIDRWKVAVAVPLALSRYRRYLRQVAEFVSRVG